MSEKTNNRSVIVLPLFIRGVTLIEVIVVVSVLLIITSVLVFQNSRGREGSEVKNAAHELSVVLRELQASALGVEGVGGEFEGEFGLNFSDASRNIDVRDFVTFVDTNDNQLYDPGTDDLIEQFSLPERVELHELSGQSASGPRTVAVGQPPNNRGFTIIFRRPKPDAAITLHNPGTEFAWSEVDIILKSAIDASVTSTVSVFTTGQISVE